ncbi:MAG TPA: hypothetical protein VK870_08395 [Ignavibacteriaceae bacterium]|nr:hypothetical protein [Ignavibacteriaceae bacterium]
MKKLLLYLVVAVFAVSITVLSQEQQNEFPIGAFMDYNASAGVLDSYNNSGMNTVVWHADTITKSFLSSFNVMAFNLNSSDWINHYATACYSRWESEENQTDMKKIGVKHTGGKDTTWNDTTCWSTLGLVEPQDSLVFGPHYFQGKVYRRVYGDRVIKFISRFNMAFDRNPQADTAAQVCRIKVLYRYAELNNTEVKYDMVFLEDILKVSDFPENGSFKIFDFDNQTYQYDISIFPAEEIGRYAEETSEIDYTDWITDTGIQFCVDWLGDPTLGTLYVDFAEVYDNEGWNDYISNPTIVVNRITNYLSNYSTSEWPNIKYWYAHDEPRSIDDFIPIRTVDSLVRNEGGAPLITHFFEVNVFKNGDWIYEQFYNSVQPEKLMFNAYPFHTDPIPGHDYISLPLKFQISHNLQPGFHYVPQAFARYNSENEIWGWYKPSPSEMRAITMLALAHGSKGIMFSDYSSYTFTGGGGGKIDAIVDEEGNHSYLWYEIHDNLAPRLRGNLGNTLMNLNYSGNYINVEYKEGYPPEGTHNNYDYLNIQHYGMSYHWHSGFFQKINQPDNKFFLLTNLRTGFPVEAKLIISNNTGYENVSFTDIEGGVDTTLGISSSITYYETLPEGEGKLFRVSPVIKYGGRLIYHETAGEGITLFDDMIIENGATLYVSGNYYSKANITVKSGGKIAALANGKIIFDAGKGIIVEGNVQIYGTANDRLELDFNSGGPGVTVNFGGSLSMSYCDINNAVIGINAEAAGTVNISNVNFTNCQYYGIVLFGFGNGDITPPHRLPQFTNVI